MDGEREYSVNWEFKTAFWVKTIKGLGYLRHYLNNTICRLRIS